MRKPHISCPVAYARAVPWGVRSARRRPRPTSKSSDGRETSPAMTWEPRGNDRSVFSRRRTVPASGSCSRRPGTSASSTMRRCSGIVVLIPTTANSSSARRSRAIACAASARARSAWRSCCRNRAARRSRRRARESTRTPRPARRMERRHPARRRHESLRVLGGDPALDGVAAEPDIRLPVSQRSPAAMRICSRTRSTSHTISVTGCSTCNRVFISMNANCPSWYRNSSVPALR